jgi:alpha-galactosidase
MNYANPNAMITWAANKYGKVRTLGLCHGVEGGRKLIAKALKADLKEIDTICAGINHQTWFIEVRQKGRLVPQEKILEAMEADPEISKNEKVRIDMFRRFGCFSTESNGHLSEYLPWYRKRPSELSDWINLDSWISGETAGGLRVVTEGRNWFMHDFPNWMKEAPVRYEEKIRTHEHGSHIIEALETGRVYRGYFNTVNNTCISNLPPDAVIEAPGYVDANGISMPIVGNLPLGCAAVCNASISVQRLAVEAAVHGDDKLLRQAMMMDPLTGAVCTPPEIRQMTDELLAVLSDWLPQYKKAVGEAEKRLKSGKLVPYRGKVTDGLRNKTKTVEDMKQDAEAATGNASTAEK